MAEELRWETLVGTVGDGTSASNAEAEFRNRTDEIMHIRRVEEAHLYSTAGPNEGGNLELSKSPSYIGGTNGTPFYTLQRTIGMPATGASAVDGRIGVNFTTLYAKGQLTLEPNESLFVNIQKTSGGEMSTKHTLGYHF